MDKGIILLAISNANYFYLAYNAAASIRVKNKNIPITLFYDPDSNIPKHLNETSHVDFLFDELVRLETKDYKRNGRKEVGIMKSKLYFLSPYEETIYVDADSQINPTYDIENAFSFFKDKPLWFNVDTIYKNQTLKSPDNSFGSSFNWVNYDDIKKYQKESYLQYPQLGSFFHGFKKCKAVDDYFETVLKMHTDFLNEDLWYNDFWGSMIPDEAIFISSLVQHPKLFKANNNICNHFFCDSLGTIDQYGIENINKDFVGVAYSGDEINGKHIYHYERRNKENFSRLGIDYQTPPNYEFSLFRH